MRITFIGLVAFFSVATCCLSAPQICPKNGPTRMCFAYLPVDGCLCTAPGVCKNAKADPCSVCNDRKVYSFETNKTCDSAVTTKVCTPQDRLVRCFAYIPVDGCICSAPGICQNGKADPCSVCNDSKVYSFAAGVSC